MEQRVSVITLGVGDVDRSRKFYEDGLGWRRANKGEEIVFFQANGMVVALFPWERLAADAQVAADGQGFRGVTVAYCTPYWPKTATAADTSESHGFGSGVEECEIIRPVVACNGPFA